MNVGDRVSFLQQYGPPVSRIFGGEYRYVYRRRRVYGTVKKILIGPPETAIIEIDGAGYCQGMPVSKVQLIESKSHR